MVQNYSPVLNRMCWDVHGYSQQKKLHVPEIEVDRVEVVVQPSKWSVLLIAMPSRHDQLGFDTESGTNRLTNPAGVLDLCVQCAKTGDWPSNPVRKLP